MDRIQQYFPAISQLQIEQFSRLGVLYREWNEKVNLISRKDIDNIYSKHILHSLAIAKIWSPKMGDTTLDIGTGGGFPGVPLAILFPEAQFHLVDSIGKKIAVVRDIADQLDLSNISSFQARVEDLPHRYDYAVSRAVAKTSKLLEWVENKVSKEMFLLKGGDLTKELEEIRKTHKILQLYDIFPEDFFQEKVIIKVLL